MSLDTQKEEFDALAEASKALDRLPPIVEDSYPEHRSRYEGAVYRLVRALKENGRIP